MLFTATNESAGFGESAIEIVRFEGFNDEVIQIDHSDFLFTADYSRDGNDLLITGSDGHVVLIENYFLNEELADLQAPEGGILRGEVVEALAGPANPGIYAQASSSQAADAIGQVEEVSGTASVQRSDGTTEPLQLGTKVFQNDVVVTEDGSSLSITFQDGTIFSLSESSRMVLSELVYAPQSENNSAVFNLVEGSFVFIAGEVAKTGEMDVQTPVATMGIRGTTVKVDIETRNGVTTVEVSLNTDPDGNIGSFTITGLNGEVIADVQATDSKWIIAPDGNSATEVDRTQVDFGDDLILIDRAVNAYENAQGRVSRGGNFVEPDGQNQNGPGQNPENNGNQEGPGPNTPNTPQDRAPGDQGRLNGSGLETDTAFNSGNPGAGRGGVNIPNLNPRNNDDNGLPQGGRGGSNNPGGQGLGQNGPNNGFDPFFNPPTEPDTTTTTTTATGDPVVTVPSSVASVAEDGSANLGGFGFSSPSGSDLTVEITVGSTIRLNPESGVTIISGKLEPGTTDQYHSVVIEGTPEQINNALNGATYTATPDDDDGGFIRIIATDDSGGTVTVEVVIPITPSNDPPVVDEAYFDVGMGQTITGTLTATDVDGDVVTFDDNGGYPISTAVGGSIEIQSDGSFSYTPLSEFTGFDFFTVTVEDENGATSTGTVHFEVSQESVQTGSGQDVTVRLSRNAENDNPAGNLAFDLSSFTAPNINLAFGLDGSGSVGASGWLSTVSAVSGALSSLNSSLSNSQVNVDVHVFEFAGSASGANILALDEDDTNGSTTAGTNLHKFDLRNEINDLTSGLTTEVNGVTVAVFPFNGGGTPWHSAFQQAQAFFANEPASDTNYFYFLTDGNPSNSDPTWQEALAALQNAVTVEIQTFGVGSGFNDTFLKQIDSDGTVTAVDDFNDLSNALSTSGLFPASIVNWTLTLRVDYLEVPALVLDETSNLLVEDAGGFDLALADIINIENLLGTQNDFSVTATVDLDGDESTTADQVTLKSFESIDMGTASVDKTGTTGNDLLLGSSQDDEITGLSGADVILTGGGNDTINISDLGFKAIDGGDGIDRLNLLGDNLVLDFSQLDMSKVKSVEGLVFEGDGSQITLTESNVIGFSDDVDGSFFNSGEEAIYISGDENDTITLNRSGQTTGGWELDANRTTASTEFYNFVNGADVLATIAVDEQVEVNIVA